MTIAYLNGEFTPLTEARISPMDRGFLLGDGIYEILPAYRGKLFSFAEHFARLEKSLAAIQLTTAPDAKTCQSFLQELVTRNGGGDQFIYLQITRGVSLSRDHVFPDHVTPTVFAYTTPIHPAPMEEIARGITAITLPDNRWQHCHIKTISLMGNVLLRQAAKVAGAPEAILIRDGHAIEGVASNLFIVDKNTLITPPADGHILRGITRDLVLKIAHQLDIACVEQAITESMLRGASEVFVTSSIKEILPVVKLDQQLINDGKAGPVWQKLINAYRDYQKQQVAL